MDLFVESFVLLFVRWVLASLAPKPSGPGWSGGAGRAAGLGGENARLVRIQCESSTHKSLISRLRDALPLSSVSLVENVVEGTFEAQVIFPEGATRRQLATLNVERRSWARCLKFATELFTIAGVGVASLAILARGLGI